MGDTSVITALEKALEAPELTAGPRQVVEEKIPHRLGGHHVKRRIFATWYHPQLKGPLGVVNHSVGIGAEEGSPSIHLVQIDAPDAAFIAAANPLSIRTLLDAHASALRDAAKLRVVLARLETAVDWHLGRSGFTQSTQLKGVEHGANVRKELYAAHDAARAALDDNTKDKA